MLLADVSLGPGPEDPFKANRVFGEGKKVLPEKVTTTNHWSNEDLNSDFSPLRNHKHKQRWSEYMDQFNGSERFLAGVISKAIAEETKCARRELDLQTYLSQPQRGSKKQNNTEMTH